MSTSNTNLKVHFSSEKQDWETPQNLFDELNKEFNFVLDVCATQENAKCDSYLDEEINGLSVNWGTVNCWMNPPYKNCKEWIKKASDESKKGSLVVALIPARTDTKYFHQYIYNQPNVEIRFLKGRLKFSGHKNAAPFPSMIVVFYP